MDRSGRAGPTKASGSPLRVPRFRRFLLGYGVSLVGDQLYFIALPWAVLQLTGSPTVTGMLLATTTLPRAVLMLAGGLLVDRAGSRRVMLVADLIRATVMVAAAVLIMTDATGVAGLFVVAAVFGVVEAAAHPATGALPRQLVGTDELTAANGLRVMMLRLSAVFGPPIAGLLVTTGEIGWLLVANGATFLVSFATMLSIDLPAPARPAAEGGGRLRTDLFAGVRYASGQPVLATLLPLSAVIAAMLGVLTNVGQPLLAHRHGWGASGFGLMTGGFGVGAFAGASVHGLRLMRRPFTGGLILICMAVQSGCFAVLPLGRSLVSAVALLAAIGFLTSFTGGPLVSLVQAAATEEMLGRVMSLFSLTVVGLTPLAFSIGGFVADRAGLTVLFVGGAAVQAVACAAGLRSKSIRSATPRSLQAAVAAGPASRSAPPASGPRRTVDSDRPARRS